MDLSTVPQSLNAVTQDLKQENDRPSVVTLIQDLAFVVEELSDYLRHDTVCASNRPGNFEGCNCGHDQLQDQIYEVLHRAQEARR